MRALKKGSFRLVHRNLWEAFAKFGKGHHREAFVFLYLETGPHSNYTGLFQAPLVDIARYTSMTNAEVIDAIDNLSRWGWIVYDKDRQMVFVPGMLQRQLGTKTPNEDNLKGVIFHVERLPEESPAVEAFISANRGIPEIDDLFEVMFGTLNDKQLTVIPKKDFGITSSVPTISSTPESPSTPDGKPKLKYSPDGSSPSSTPEAGKAKPKSKASGRGKRGNGKSDAWMKKKGLRIAAEKFDSLEWDLARISEELRNTYGFTSEEINSKEVRDALGIFQGEMKEATQ